MAGGRGPPAHTCVVSGRALDVQISFRCPFGGESRVEGPGGLLVCKSVSWILGAYELSPRDEIGDMVQSSRLITGRGGCRM